MARLGLLTYDGSARAFWSINLTVLTRDSTHYRSHFPRLALVCPG